MSLWCHVFSLGNVIIQIFVNVSMNVSCSWFTDFGGTLSSIASFHHGVISWVPCLSSVQQGRGDVATRESHLQEANVLPG